MPNRTELGDVPSTISPLQRALDELEASILDGKAALHVLGEGGRAGSAGTQAGYLAGADQLGRRFEAVREAIRAALPAPAVAARAADLLAMDTGNAGEWVEGVRGLLREVVASRMRPSEHTITFVPSGVPGVLDGIPMAPAPTLAADRVDSGMTATERGTPYTLEEAEAVVQQHAMDGHHRELMNFLIRRVRRIDEERTKDLHVMTAQGKEIERLRGLLRVSEFEDVPAVRDQLWCLSTATLDAIRRDIDAGLTSSQIRDEIISKVGMMASARTPEMQARYDAALDREALARRPDPTRQSVNSRVAHDLTVIAARMVRDYPGMPPGLNLGDIRRMANFVLAHSGEGPASPPASEPRLDQPWVADLKKELAGRRAAAERAVSVKRDLAEQLFDAFWGTIVNAGWPMPVAWEALHESQRNAWRGVADAARRSLDQDLTFGAVVGGLGAAQLVYTAPATKAEASPNLQAAIGEMDSGLNALVNELAPDVVQNLRTRFEDVLRHTNNQLLKPSHELEALRNFHERVTHSIRLISHIMRADTTAEEAFHQLAKEVLENNGQALMKPPPNSLYTGVLPEAPGLINSPQMPVTIRPDGAYTAGPPSDGRPVADHLDELASGPAVKLVIDIARRVVSRGMHERTAGTAHGGFELLPNDINILTQLAKAVAALDKEKP